MDTVKRMPDGFIDCVVTSPPYYGLRDYGTAKWEGGDKGCDHRTFDNDIVNAGKKQKTNVGSNRTFKDVCRRCGAKRIDDQFGLEETPEAFVKNLVDLFREIRRALKDSGTVWLNLGDSYASVKSRYSSKPHSLSGKDRGDNHNKKPDLYHYAKDAGIKDKDLLGIPWMVAFALRADGWCLRQDIIWHKPNPMPESVTDRCTKAHEYIFLLAKSQRYFYDADAVKEKANYDGRKDTVMKGSQKYNNAVVPGQAAHTFAVGGHERWQLNDNGEHVRNKRSVWTVTTKPFKDAHFATFPEDLIVPCIKAGCPEGGTVYDPFMGAGTTALVAHKLNRNWIGSELNPEYMRIAEKRLKPLLTQYKLIMQ